MDQIIDIMGPVHPMGQPTKGSYGVCDPNGRGDSQTNPLLSSLLLEYQPTWNHIFWAEMH